ncbi:hypothetical protein LguiA_021302 [Lonicera macranthoides]
MKDTLTLIHFLPPWLSLRICKNEVDKFASNMNICETAISSLFIAFQSWYQVPGCALKRRCLKWGECGLEWGLNHFLGLWRNNGRTY